MAVVVGVAVLVALVATPLAARVARRLGVVDHPGELKVHATPVPYLGGVAVLVAMAGPLAAHRPALLLPLALALALGVADDSRGLSPRARVVGEVVIGVVAGLVEPAPGPVALGVALTAVAVVALVNAVNLLDGLDGLAAGVCAVGAIGFAIVSPEARAPALALAGALGGFLVFNRPPARIYLGDGGSYLLGTTLALGAVLLVSDADTWAAWVAAPLFVAVPVADTLIAIVRRRRARRPLFAGDRSHVYDQLVDRGWSPPRTVLACVGAQVVLAALAIAAVETPAALGAAIAAATLVVLAVGLVAGGFVTTTTEPTR
ncbi:MAG TPA: MraY family glycosyltransferase [Acidimicrobiia bacterium]|nr:MraY family glycosyltransferase [Acidimicrobiia bacterium]